MSRERRTGGQIIVEYLRKENVKYVFGIPGHGSQGITDALYDSGIQFVSAYHEMVGAAAAAGYFKATHTPGVLCLTCGPGMVTAIPSLVQAALDNVAVIVIAGDIAHKYWDRGANEEVDLHAGADQRTLYRPFAKRVWLVNKADQIPRIMANAFNVALTGRPGVVLIDVPLDVQSEVAEVQTVEPARYRPTMNIRGGAAETSKAATLLAASDKPIVYAGGGAVVSEAHTETRAIAELLGAPVATSLSGQGIIASTHPLFIGQPGYYGPTLANKMISEADVVLALGARFEEHQTSNWIPGLSFNIPPTKLIHVNIDPREIGKNYPVEVGIVGDVKSVLRDLITEVGKRISASKCTNRRKALESQISDCKEQWLAKFTDFRNDTAIPINPYRLVKEMSLVFPKNGVMVTSSSINRVLQMQEYFPVEANNYFMEHSLQVIGYACAEALGIKLGRPGQPVIVAAGDGGFLLMNQCLAVAVSHEIPVIWVIMNNFGYGSLAGEQKKLFGRTVGVEWKISGSSEDYSPDYAKLAEAYGAFGERIEKPEEIRGAMERAIKSNRPYVLDVRVGGPQAKSLNITTMASWQEFGTVYKNPMNHH